MTDKVLLARTSRQLPAWTVDSKDFWTGGGSGQLLISKCGDCHGYHHPPAPVCHLCLSRNVVPAPVSGLGTIVSFTVNHQPWLPGMQVPFIVAYVSIAEQSDVWLMTNVIGCTVDAVSVGAKVRVVFEQQEDVWIPLFELVQD